jgi:hypothetical protein
VKAFSGCRAQTFSLYGRPRVNRGSRRATACVRSINRQLVGRWTVNQLKENSGELMMTTPLSTFRGLTFLFLLREDQDNLEPRLSIIAVELRD